MNNLFIIFLDFRSTAHHTYVNTSQFNSQIEQTISASQSNNSNIGAHSSSSSPHSVSSAPPSVGFVSASAVTSMCTSGEPQKYDTIDTGTFKIKHSLSKRDASPHGTKPSSHRASKLQKAASLESRPTYATITIEPQRLYNYGDNFSGQNSPRVPKSNSGHVIPFNQMGYSPSGAGGSLHSSRSDHHVMLYENHASSGSPRDSSPHSVQSTSSSQSIHSISQPHRTSSPLVVSR